MIATVHQEKKKIFFTITRSQNLIANGLQVLFKPLASHKPGTMASSVTIKQL